jgi:hypothetical protein
MNRWPVSSPAGRIQRGARLPDLRDGRQVLLVFNEKTLKAGGIADQLLTVATYQQFQLGFGRKG